MVFHSYSEAETFQIAYDLAKQAQRGDVFCLVGDLGVGKTLFAQGFAAGLGITDPVTSPTFTIVQTYEKGRLPMYHFDVYRMGDSDELFDLGFAEMIDGDGVCVIEWADMILGSLPSSRIMVHIEKNLDRDADFRKVTVIRENARQKLPGDEAE